MHGWEYLEVRVDDSQDTFARKWEYLRVSADRMPRGDRRRLIRHGPVLFNLDRDIANNGYELLDSVESAGIYVFFLRRQAGRPAPPWETLDFDEW